MNSLKKIYLIINKDLMTELRTRELFPSMFIFAFLVIIIFNFTFDPGTTIYKDIAPGILWVAFCFAGVLGLNRSFLLEKERESISGLMLCPFDRGIIYISKTISNLMFMVLMELMILPIFAIFFDVSILFILPKLILILFLGSLGFAGVGTLFSAMSASTRMREAMLPILLFPVLIPVIIAAVKSTGKILAGRPLMDISSWIKLLIGFDLLFILISYLTFEFVIEE